MLADLDITTARLYLRRPEPEDAKHIFNTYASDPEATKYLVFLPHRDISESHEFIQSRIDNILSGRSFTWLIALRGSDPIGTIELRFAGTGGDVGFAISRDWWGKGIAAEALRAVLDFARDRLALTLVTGMCDAENVRSARVFEKCGFQNLGIKDRAIVHPAFGDAPRAAVYFELKLNERGSRAIGQNSPSSPQVP